MLITQSLKNALSCMSLLAVDLFIRLENLLNDRQEGIDLRSTRLGETVSRWLAVRENLLQSVPVNVILTARCTLADLVVEYTTTNLRPLLHVGKHPSLAASSSNKW